MARLFYYDMVFMIINILLLTEVIDVEELKTGNQLKVVISSLATTSIGIITTILDMWFNSSALGENPIAMLMHLMTAKSSWLPFEAQIQNRTLNKNIDLTKIEGKFPGGLTAVTGIFYRSDFKFGDETFERFVYELTRWEQYSS